MPPQPRTPLKVITALVNVGFIVAAIVLPQFTFLPWLALGVWLIHGGMAVAAIPVTRKKGLDTTRWVAEVLLVGTISFAHLRRTAASN